MDNQPTTPLPTPQTLQPTQPAGQTSAKSNRLLIVILSVLLIIAISIACLFYFQIQKLSKEVAKYQAQPSPTPVATADPTANWKVFMNSQGGFSLKYPNTWNDPTKSQLSTRTGYDFVPQNLSITIGFYYNQDLQRPRTYEEEIADEEKSAVGKKTVLIGNQNTTEYINFIGVDLSTIEVTVILKGAENNIIWIEMPFPQGTDPSIFDQILSTFKFTGSTSIGITKDEAVQLVKSLDEVKTYLVTVPNAIVEFDHESDDKTLWVVHVYEIKDNHTATFNWYEVNKSSSKINKMF